MKWKQQAASLGPGQASLSLRTLLSLWVNGGSSQHVVLKAIRLFTLSVSRALV